MRKLIFTTLLIVAFVTTSMAQVGIGTTNPNASSVLDLTSTNKAFIPPRMTTAQRAAIVNPVAGMVVFNTDSSCIEIYRGTVWFNVCTGKSSGVTLPNVDGYSSSNQVAASNLIGYWPFDGSSTENNSGLPPVLSGGTASYVTGRIGQAVQLTNGWFTYPTGATAASNNNTGNGSNDTLRNGFTISLWTKKIPDTSTLSTLFQLSSPNIPNWPLLGIQYRKHADSTVDFDGGFSNVDASGPTVAYAALFTASAFKDTGAWAFIAMEYDTTSGRNLRYYYNGSLVATWNVASYFVSSATEPLQVIAPNYASIGCAEGTGYTPGSSNAPAGYMSYGINGTIDDVRFFNTTLSTQKISDLYQLGNQGR